MAPLMAVLCMTIEASYVGVQAKPSVTVNVNTNQSNEAYELDGELLSSPDAASLRNAERSADDGLQ